MPSQDPIPDQPPGYRTAPPSNCLSLMMGRPHPLSDRLLDYYSSPTNHTTGLFLQWNEFPRSLLSVALVSSLIKPDLNTITESSKRCRSVVDPAMRMFIDLTTLPIYSCQHLCETRWAKQDYIRGLYIEAVFFQTPVHSFKTCFTFTVANHNINSIVRNQI